MAPNSVELPTDFTTLRGIVAGSRWRFRNDRFVLPGALQLFHVGQLHGGAGSQQA